MMALLPSLLVLLGSMILLGLLVVVAVIIGLIFYGRKRQRKAQAKRAEMTEQQRQPTNRAARRRG